MFGKQIGTFFFLCSGSLGRSPYPLQGIMHGVAALALRAPKRMHIPRSALNIVERNTSKKAAVRSWTFEVERSMFEMLNFQFRTHPASYPHTLNPFSMLRRSQREHRHPMRASVHEGGAAPRC